MNQPNLSIAPRPSEPKPRAPKHLRPATRRFWLSVVRDYELEPHHVLILTAACEALDKAMLAREAVEQDGAFFVDRHGDRKPHPGINVERDSKGLFAKLIRQLNLDPLETDRRRGGR